MEVTKKNRNKTEWGAGKVRIVLDYGAHADMAYKLMVQTAMGPMSMVLDHSALCDINLVVHAVIVDEVAATVKDRQLTLDFNGEVE